MWYNGFLQNLDIDLRPRGLSRTGQTFFIEWIRQLMPFRSPVVNRIVARRSGSWLLETSDGQKIEASLAGGWIVGNGRYVGLYWESDEGSRLRCWLAGWRHDAVTRRRFLVRLKLPVKGASI